MLRVLANCIVSTVYMPINMYLNVFSAKMYHRIGDIKMFDYRHYPYHYHNHCHCHCHCHCCCHYHHHCNDHYHITIIIYNSATK